MKKVNSSIDVRDDQVNSSDFSLNYSYSFDKNNYWSPFKSWENIPIIGKSLFNTKIYYSPEKFQTTMNLSESEQNKIMRSGIETNTYELGMNRSYVLNYKVTDNLSCFASLLTPQGKFLYEFIVVKHKSGYFIDCEKSQSVEIFEQLNSYKIRSKVEILNLSNEFDVASIGYDKYLTISN